MRFVQPHSLPVRYHWRSNGASRPVIEPRLCVNRDHGLLLCEPFEGDQLPLTTKKPETWVPGPTCRIRFRRDNPDLFYIWLPFSGWRLNVMSAWRIICLSIGYALLDFRFSTNVNATIYPPLRPVKCTVTLFVLLMCYELSTFVIHTSAEPRLLFNERDNFSLNWP
jgi:hypothetical protein